MWYCENCEKSFEEPKAAYSIDDRITTSDNPDFSAMAFLHESSWYYCPLCGSDQIIDKDELKD